MHDLLFSYWGCGQVFHMQLFSIHFIGGEDYKEIRNVLLTFDNDTSEQTVEVTVFEDNIVEDTEEFFLTLTDHLRIVKRLDLQITPPFASISISGTSC